MASNDSSPATVVNERVYVAVGNDVEESRLTLQWALLNFDGDFRILHVLTPSSDSPGAIFVPRVRAIHAMEEILDEYVRICRHAKVSVEKRWIEMRDIGKGIVELIEQHAVTRLVMGAAADRNFTEGMKELKSTKAKFVNQYAHPSCQIWFICNGHLIDFRKGDLTTIDMDISSSWPQTNSVAATVPSEPRSPSVSSVLSASYSSEIENDVPLLRYERGEASRHATGSNLISSYEEDRQLALLPVLEENGNDDLYEKLERAMAEAADAKREAYQELLRRQKAEKSAIEISHRAKILENLYSEELRRRKELEEILAKEREDFETFNNRQTEELSVAHDQRTLQESQLENSNHMMQELQDKIAFNEDLLEICKKEQEDLRVHLENALKVNEELLFHQVAEPSTYHRQQVVMEFSFSEIQEATDNFDPSLKLKEGDWGSIYKGFLRHTPVTIKMLHSGSSQGPSQYHLEVELVSKLRHPNLVALIGVCPDAWALIYEHASNGCLDDQLSRENNLSPLSWKDRIRISMEICLALIFLHSCNPNTIVHGDLNPKNVLLDSNLVSKLIDLRIPNQNSVSGSSEDGHDLRWESSVKSDVYSFGVLILQLLTGKSAPNLAAEVQDALLEGNINDMLDQTAGDWPFMETTQLALLALSCCEINRLNPPDLRTEVWFVLESIKASCEASTESPRQNDSNRPNDPPSYLICPISQEIMEDPHVAADGFTYEKTAIQEWLRGGHGTSPMTNLQLPNDHLLPNRALRSAIQDWMQNH
ncbi:hypothetical protein SAY86_011203 [Trapa natans]|uniref:RING-type E3 ubiquitin transferase n=1 Tax=Trapa natans TaxID=22666 RepID=A0AAN7R403_TRANT|nr:hypothetical protein SAY86_011203 [Trapa natans]